MEQAELLAFEKPVTRAIYDPQLKHPRPRPVPSKPPAAVLPDGADLLAKYDVRSARGGKGGQVAAVASIWQNGGSDQTSAPNSEPQLLPKRYTMPAGLAQISNRLDSQSDQTSFMASSPGAAKSASVPAMMHATTAVPILSSTASLSRPPGGPNVRARMMTFPASVPESQSDETLVRRASQPTEGVAVGQARLKELIERYQS